MGDTVRGLPACAGKGGDVQIEVRLDGAHPRRWHRELLDSLSSRGDVGVTATLVDPTRHADSRSVEWLLRTERVLHRINSRRSAPIAVSSFADFAAPPEHEPDLVLDLCHDPQPTTSRCWRLTYDSVPGEQAALRSLLAGRTPVVAVEDARTGTPLAGGRPGSERPGIVAAAFDDLLAGCATLVHAALDGAESKPPDAPTTADLTTTSVARRAAQELAGTVLQTGYRCAFRAPHWRVGWRFVDGPDVIDLLDHPDSGWRDLPDDGHHFYADPFPIEVAGRTYLFVEDFDHRVGRGVISVVPFDDDGPVGAPRPVLTRDVHLSYPFVLEADGQVWMIPETSGAATIELYRAAAFPDRWVREAVLVDDVVASDATVFVHGGRWWMTATVRRSGSYSDTLWLWFADALHGPWKSHPGNPVLVDIASARPGGRVVRRDGRLIRPVQDNRAGYGAALGLAEITRLDDSGFDQRLLSTVRPGPRWRGRRVHTLNRAGRLECIDGSGWSPRLGRTRF